jgi:hypothetical protein
MKIYLLQVGLILVLGLPVSLNAQDPSEWLVNLKREVTKLAVSERAYLHSIARLSNSVMRDEDLFFVSVLDLEKLDIRLLPDGRVFVSAEEVGSASGRDNLKGAGAAKWTPKICSKSVEKTPRLVLIVEGRDELRVNPNAHERKFLAHTHKFLNSALGKGRNFRLSPYSAGASRYDNLLQGNGFSKYEHKLLVKVRYEDTLGATAFSKLNPKFLFSGVYQSHNISVELQLHKGDIAIKKMKATLSLAEVGSEAPQSQMGRLRNSSEAQLKRLEGSIDSFLAESKCLVKHSNMAVAVKGKLILGAGMDAGYTEGDQLLLMPKAGYFKKRGLLSGVEQMAIARIKKIYDLKSELEVEQGAVRLESGVEFVVRPLLELI